MIEPFFKIEWLIDLIKEQEPDRLDLIEQLRNSERKQWVRQAYINLVSTEQPNQLDSKWQFKENIVLEHEKEGTLVLDILKNGQIGGVEFLNNVV